MRTRLPPRPVHALVLAAFAAAVTFVLIAAGGHDSTPGNSLGLPSWKGLAGAQRPRVAVGQRVIVVLNSPSLADRLLGAGGPATPRPDRRSSAGALASPSVPTTL